MSSPTTEEDLFWSLYWTYTRQGAGVARHASVGETFFQMRKRAGRANHSVRRIDALVIKRNAAGADTMMAVEIKVSAADLRKEISTPEKTEAWAQYVDQFYFYVPPHLEALAREVVPPQYGIMVAEGGYFMKIVRRARRNGDKKPLPLDTWRRLAVKLGEYQIEAIQKKRLQRYRDSS